jgi:glucose-6-phosphate 1-dehydrogenase
LIIAKEQSQKMNHQKVYPAAITIFGAKGDLTRRKLIPALYNLFLGKHLPAVFTICCVDYVQTDETDFKNDLQAGVNEFSRNGKADPAEWKTFANRLHYIAGDFLKADTFLTLKERLDIFDKENKTRGTRMFYYAVAPVL